MTSRLAVFFAACACVVGCSAPRVPFVGTGSDLLIESRTHAGTRLDTDFDRAVYSYDGKQVVTIVLFDGPETAPEQAATVRLLWTPRAGRTPITSQATNATIQYVILPDAASDRGEVGIYSGAGFLYPDSEPGDGTFVAEVWDATILLADGSPGFNDRLGKGSLRGDLTARRDDAAVEDLLKVINERITQRLGYPRMVVAD